MNQYSEVYLNLLENLDYTSAEKLLKDELNSRPDPKQPLHAGLAVCYVRDNKIQESKEEISKALEAETPSFLIHIALALLAGEEGNFIVAEEEHKKAVEVEGNASYSWFMYGAFLMSQGRYSESVEKFLQAQKINNRSWASKTNLAYLYLRIKKYNTALKYAMLAFALRPNVITLRAIVHILMNISRWFVIILLAFCFLKSILYPPSFVAVILLGSIGLLYSAMHYFVFAKKFVLLSGLCLALISIVYSFMIIMR
jgi:Tfp pilus assembly protein PilF